MSAQQIRTNNSKIGTHAIVIGASMSGLLASRVLSDYFQRVTLIERDQINDRPESRKGQPQTRHLHGLLPRGLDIMTRLFPDLPRSLRQGGAVFSDMGADMLWHAFGGYRLQFQSGLVGALMSRTFLEWQIRRRVVALPNVSVLDQCKIERLLTTAGGRVTGVSAVHDSKNEQEAALAADLVVDATGRGSAAPRWLEAMGYPRPMEDNIKVGIGYATQIYRRRPGDLTGANVIMIAPEPPYNKRMGLIFSIEADRWMLMLGGWAGDHAPTDQAGFLEFARSLAVPDIYNLITHLEPLTDIITHKFPSSRRRHYEKLNRFPEGFLVMGDAIGSFNPVYGQGMTSAAMQAAELDELLASRRSQEGLWMPFFKRAAKVVDIPWQLAAAEDFRFRETRGKKAPGTNLINAYVAKVHQATHHDPVVYDAFLRVMNFMAPPMSLLKPRILWRVLRGRKGKAAGRGVASPVTPWTL